MKPPSSAWTIVQDPCLTNEVNVDGTLSVLEEARSEKARVVVASSAAVYGHPDSIPIEESQPKNPSLPYGLQKLAVYYYTQQSSELYGLETVAFRYFNVYGPRQQAGVYTGVISTFLQQTKAGDPLTVHGDGHQTRDFVHVEDIVQANLQAAKTEYVGEAFNIGTGTTTDINELARSIRSVLCSNSDIVNVEPRPGDIEQSCADITKALEKLGYVPQIDLESGL